MWKQFYQESSSNDVSLITFLDNMYIDIFHHFCPGCFYGFRVPFAQGLVTRSSLNVIRLRVVSRYKTTSGLIIISKAIPGKPPEASSRIYLNQLLRGWQVKWWIIHQHTNGHHLRHYLHTSWIGSDLHKCAGRASVMGFLIIISGPCSVGTVEWNRHSNSI